MRTAFWLLAVPLAGFGLWHFAHSHSPSAGALEPLVRGYLAHSCNGDLDIKQLDSIRVGAYSEQFGGWPVYANHVEVCAVHHSSPYAFTAKTTNESSHDADHDVAIAFARRTWSGRVELYTPELFEAGERQMQQALDHAFDHVKVN